MEEKIIYKSENFDLSGLLSRVNDNDLIVVLCHGYLSDKYELRLFDMMVDKLIVEKINSFRFDFRGHGQSTGNEEDISLTGEIRDLENTLDMLKENGFNKFILIGSSLGGCIISLINHKKYNILNLNIWYGALDFNEIKNNVYTEENMKIAKEKGFFAKHNKHNNKERKIAYQLFLDFTNYKPIDNLKNLNLPILFVHGDKDELVNVKSSINAHNLCKKSKLIIIENGTHLFLDSIEHKYQLIEDTINFMKQNME